MFDYYSGQNKNHMVLCMKLLLIDIDIFKEVKIMFLKAGHTKHICDRRFKDMNKGLS